MRQGISAGLCMLEFQIRVGSNASEWMDVLARRG